MNESLISIIVPIYKVEKYLKRCIESIINQTYKNLEIILVDDGSPDDCPEICDEYQQKDTRIKVIHKKNGGLSDARNAGIDIAKGKYIAFIDSDDYVEEDYIEVLYNLCEENECEMAQGNFVRVYNGKVYNELKDTKKETVQIYSKQEYINKLYLEDYVNVIVAWNKLYSRKLFEKIRYPKGKIHEDEYTTYKLIYKANKIASTNRIIYNYFFDKDSITNQKYSEKRLDILGAKKERMEFFKEKEEKQLYEFASKDYCITLMDTYVKTKKYIPDSKDIQKNIKKKFNENIFRVLFYKNVKIKSKIAIIIAYISPILYETINKIKNKI